MINKIKEYLDDGDCSMCPALFTGLSFVVGFIIGGFV